MRSLYTGCVVALVFLCYGCANHPQNPEQSSSIIPGKLRTILNGNLDVSHDHAYVLPLFLPVELRHPADIDFFRNIFPLAYSLAGPVLPLFKCSSVLISNRLLLTAAHCVTDDNRNLADTSQTLVGGPETDAALGVNSFFLSRASEIVIHPNYEPVFTGESVDLAVIGLLDSSYPAGLARPIYVGPDPLEASTALAVGFGDDGQNPDGSPADDGDGEFGRRLSGELLVEGFHSVLTQSSAQIDKAYITTKLGSGGQTICNGDSGGPILLAGAVLGISVYGSSGPCVDQEGGGSVYAKTFREWIHFRKLELDPQNDCVSENAFFRSTEGGCRTLTGKTYGGMQTYPLTSNQPGSQPFFSTFTQEEAEILCEISAESGYRDWRLPSLKELIELGRLGGATQLSVSDSARTGRFWASNRPNDNFVSVDLSQATHRVEVAGTFNHVVCVRD